ncbi:hypothetical protein WB334_24945, partial [Escherichia coli]|uniref:hypothetical protein n=1 Tax=Escherichia coli TaxID=562 RepID=UPI002157746B
MFPVDITVIICKKYILKIRSESAIGYLDCWHALRPATLLLTVKAAVKEGMLSAFSENDKSKSTVTKELVEKPISDWQRLLQKEYNEGKMTFEEYQKYWDSEK